MMIRSFLGCGITYPPLLENVFRVGNAELTQAIIAKATRIKTETRTDMTLQWLIGYENVNLRLARIRQENAVDETILYERKTM